MAHSNIGIKLYDGSFVPIIGSKDAKGKKVILTTIRNGQEKTIIELYEGTSNNCINNEFLGKLVIPIERETKKGDPAIEVHLRLDENGILYARAWDTESGKESTIQIEHSSGKTIVPETLSDKEINTLESSTKVISQNSSSKKKNKLILLIILISAGVLLLLLLAVGGYFGYRYASSFLNKTKDDTTKIEKQIENTENSTTTVIVKSTTTIKSTVTTLKKEETNTIKQNIDNSNKNKENVIGKKNKEGKRYYIRWGDNLWNICKKYYSDPWYYPSLAEYNSIENSRLIFAGTYLIIPNKSDITRWDFSH